MQPHIHGKRMMLLLAGTAAVVGAHQSAAAPVTHLQAVHTSTGKIVPPLEDVASDKEFMGKDYPDDLRPGVRHFKRYDWDHPYPIVQEDSQYDKDYVKDENNDSGEWSAQHDYDVIRSKIAKTKARVDDLKRRIEAMGGDIDAIRAEEAAAEKAAKNAEGDADSARNNAAGESGKSAKLQGEEDGAAGNVKGEMGSLEKCKEELRKVEEQLKKLLKEKDAKNGDANAAELALKKAAMDAELKQMSEAELEAKLAEEKAEWEKSQKEYEKQQQELKDTQVSLDKAAERLRKFREKEDNGKGSDGGVYPVAFHSGANSRSVTLAGAFVVLAGVLCNA